MPDPTFNGDIQARTFNDYIADVAYDNFFVKTAYAAAHADHWRG